MSLARWSLFVGALLVTAIGVWLLTLPLGAAVLLGAILAPTDPVLASDVSSDAGPNPDRIGFSPAGEGGLNDGAAFPFVMLGSACTIWARAPPAGGRSTCCGRPSAGS